MANTCTIGQRTSTKRQLDQVTSEIFQLTDNTEFKAEIRSILADFFQLAYKLGAEDEMLDRQ